MRRREAAPVQCSGCSIFLKNKKLFALRTVTVTAPVGPTPSPSPPAIRQTTRRCQNLRGPFGLTSGSNRAGPFLLASDAGAHWQSR